ncbi:hypothetical protein ETN89_12155 [Photobacterium damselae subsp. damselae]|uniref:hypothetical protein n=1 Tax=Photobacterium damselae TaxID=38293 RepID=UPI000A2FFA84|nr:hypothetical protein [Photobacterium damselae]ARR49459.1 hypothetical protein CAY62_07630 [Photobacterium damselae subsp. damselae]QAY35996.1 hypothetical protein ETN89_12155 [Photobacterium damselae subsp. damselae]QOQ69684.1 hypothetical protein IL982_05210 [Photobacterium damselae subsp. damselae]
MKPLVDTTYSLSNAVNDNPHFELVDADHQDISILSVLSCIEIDPLIPEKLSLYAYHQLQQADIILFSSEIPESLDNLIGDSAIDYQLNIFDFDAKEKVKEVKSCIVEGQKVVWLIDVKERFSFAFTQIEQSLKQLQIGYEKVLLGKIYHCTSEHF